MSVQWICLDVGECLIDETRAWNTWAGVLGVPAFTLSAVFGGVIERGGHHDELFTLLGRPDWTGMIPAMEEAYGGFQPEDLYPDALPAIARLRASRLRVAVIANQPARRHRELLDLGVEVDLMAMSDALGVHKPDPAFFARALELMGSPSPGDTIYVGDRVDYDMLPALAAGMSVIRLRRGPWGILQRLPSGLPSVPEVRTLLEMCDLVDGLS